MHHEDLRRSSPPAEEPTQTACPGEAGGSGWIWKRAPDATQSGCWRHTRRLACQRLDQTRLENWLQNVFFIKRKWQKQNPGCVIKAVNRAFLELRHHDLTCIHKTMDYCLGEDCSPCWADETRPLQLHTLHQQPRLEGPDLHIAREHSDDVRRLVFWRKGW